MTIIYLLGTQPIIPLRGISNPIGVHFWDLAALNGAPEPPIQSGNISLAVTGLVFTNPKKI